MTKRNEEVPGENTAKGSRIFYTALRWIGNPSDPCVEQRFVSLQRSLDRFEPARIPGRKMNVCWRINIDFEIDTPAMPFELEAAPDSRYDLRFRSHCL